jgi:nucleoside-diphosphate-sugar epimerase
MASKNDNDKRRETRIPVDLWIEAERDGELYYQRASNLSVGGAFFVQTIPLPMAYAMAALGTAKSRLRGTDERLNLNALRLMRAETPVDHSKAVRELGWQPKPVEESIAEAARFWTSLRAAKAARRD